MTARRPPHHGAAPDGANHARLRVRAGAAGASGSEPPRARASRQSLPSSLRIQLYLSSECVNRAVLSQRICGAAARRFPWDDRGARGGLCAWGARVSSPAARTYVDLVYMRLAAGPRTSSPHKFRGPD